MGFLQLWKKIPFIKFISGAFLIIMVLLMFTQVITRYLFSISFPGLEELCGILFIYMSFLGAVIALRTNSHARFDMVISHFSKKWRSIIDVSCNIIVTIVLGVLIVAGIQSTANSHSMISSALQIPLSYTHAAFPIGMGLLFVEHICIILKTLRKSVSYKKVEGE